MIRLCLAIALLLAASPGWAQQAQQVPDPYQQLAAEWQAMALAQHHAEEAIQRLVASYEARLQTALDWLKQAQQSNDKR